MSDTNEVILAKLYYDNQLARLGLQGTLWGAWASLFAIATIAVVQVVFDRYVIKDWAFFAMVTVIVTSVTFYGVFIFNRALTVSAEIGKEGGKFFASSSEKNEPLGPQSDLARKNP
jgi:hypothetical protein